MIYCHKVGTPAGNGDGSKANPWYWYEKTSGQTVSLDNSNTSTDDKCRLYLRVKLNAGTQYNIGESRPGGGDGKIWLYDESGTEITNNDDDSATIAGVACSDHFSYTPSTTGIYIIGAGSYSSAKGSYTVSMDPAPSADSPHFIYPTSEGFNSLGKPVKYRSAREAGCGYSLQIPTDGLAFYAPLSSNQSKAATGQDLYTYNTVTYEAHKGITAAKFTGSQQLYTSTSAGLPTGNNPWTISIWMCPNGIYVNPNSGERFTTAMVLGKNCWGPVNYGCTSIAIYQSDDYVEGEYIGMTHFVMDNLNLSKLISDTWYFLAATFDGTTVKGYVNGSLIAEKTCTFNILNGGLILSGNHTSNNNLGYFGYLSSPRIYNRVLSPLQIKALSKQFKPTV